jgi:uncharacterized membrane protein YcjF (UPF0283 family)
MNGQPRDPAPKQAGALFSLDYPPEDVRPASRDELAQLEREWREASAELGAVGLDLAGNDRSARPPWQGAVLALGTIIMGLTLLVLFSQAATLLDQVSRLPAWAEPFAMAGLALIVLAILAALVRLAWVFVRLGRSPRISTKALRELAERRETRALSLQHSAAARAHLRRLLDAYPLGRAKDRARLGRLGVTPAEIERLEGAAKSLRTQDMGGDAAWIDQFDRLFVSVLDEAAQRRVNRCAWLVGLKTAVVPGGGFDAAIVIVNSYLLIADLCVIYNLRTGAWGSATVLGHVLVNALAATQVDDLAGAATDHWAGQISQHLGGLAAGLTQVAGKVAARVGDGAVNAVLTRRLGTVAIGQLRPIARQSA